MALWDKLFTMLGVGCAQLLVSQEDLADEKTSHNLQVCVEAILAMGAVPILNENTALCSTNEVRSACLACPDVRPSCDRMRTPYAHFARR
jgi:glutamate 5-kinase